MKNEKFFPKKVEFYRDKMPSYLSYKQRSDFSYSMQYLEYLKNEINQSLNTSVISKMLIKTYVVTSLSIIEMLLLQEIRKKGLQPRRLYDQPEIIKKKRVKIETDFYVFKKTKQKIVNKIILRPDFKSIIKIAINNGIFELSENHRNDLTILRRLRNKVHLNTDDINQEHDYNSFNFETYHLVNKYLKKILTYFLPKDSIEFL